MEDFCRADSNCNKLYVELGCVHPQNTTTHDEPYIGKADDKAFTEGRFQLAPTPNLKLYLDGRVFKRTATRASHQSWLLIIVTSHLPTSQAIYLRVVSWE